MLQGPSPSRQRAGDSVSGKGKTEGLWSGALGTAVDKVSMWRTGALNEYLQQAEILSFLFCLLPKSQQSHSTPLLWNSDQPKRRELRILEFSANDHPYLLTMTLWVDRSDSHTQSFQWLFQALTGNQEQTTKDHVLGFQKQSPRWGFSCMWFTEDGLSR